MSLEQVLLHSGLGGGLELPSFVAVVVSLLLAGQYVVGNVVS